MQHSSITEMRTRRTRLSKGSEQEVAEEGAHPEEEEEELPEQGPSSARRAPPPQLAAGGDDDDDEAPEEIAMSSGKELAASRRQAERESIKEAAEARKTKRKAQEERSAAQKKASNATKGISKRQKQQGEGAGAMDDEEAHAGEEDAAAHAGPEEDLLPPEILEALSRRQEAQLAAAAGTSGLAEHQARMVSLALKQQLQGKGGKSKKLLEGTKKGPVTVRVLSASKQLAASGKGNFRSERLMAAGGAAATGDPKRSFDMLRPAHMARKGPAAKFI
jgi:hypothetical protein